MDARDDRESRALAFLVGSGAPAIAHPGGNLFDHLNRTAATLRTWEASETVVLAGLCHATYGTDGFAIALLDPSHRNDLREILGDDAEALVYLYGSCDRSFKGTLPEPGRHLFRDRFTDRVSAIAADTMKDFVELTFANELDVERHSAQPALRQAIETYLRALSVHARPPAWRAFVDRYGS